MALKIPLLLLHKRSEYNHRPQATGANTEERHGNIITKGYNESSEYINTESE